MDYDILSDLVKITTQKKIQLEKILDLTKKQQQSIRDDDIKSLFSYIEKKQACIECIDKLDNLYLDKYTEFKKSKNIKKLDELNVNSYPELKILKLLVEKINQLLNEIKEYESINNKEIKERFDKVKENLRNVRAGKKLVRGYGAYNRKEGSIFIDLEG